MHMFATAIGLLCLAVAPAMAGELADLLRESLSHPNIRAAEMNESAALDQVHAARARYQGHASIMLSWHRYEDDRVIGAVVPGQVPPPLVSPQIAQVGAYYTLPIDITGQLATQLARARNRVEQQQLLATQQRLLKLHQTSTAFIALRTLQAQQRALEATRRRIEASRQRTLNEIELGRAPGIEARYADSEIARLQADEASLSGQRRQAQAALMALVGREGITTEHDDVDIPAWHAPHETLPVQLAHSAARAAELQSEQAARALKPALAFNTGFTRGMGNGGHRDNWLLGLTLNLPLSPSQSREAIALARSAEAARLQSEASERDAARQLSALRASYDAALAEAEAMKTEVDYREQLIKVAHEMQKVGSQTLENTFRHERDLLDARYRLSQAKVRAITAWSAAQTLAGVSPDTYIDRLDGS